MLLLSMNREMHALGDIASIVQQILGKTRDINVKPLGNKEAATKGWTEKSIKQY